MSITPDQLIDKGIAFATTSQSDMQKAAQTAYVNLSNSSIHATELLDYTPPTIVTPLAGEPNSGLSLVIDKAQAPGVTLATIAPVTAPVFANAPTFSIVAPSINFPTAPSTTLPNAPSGIPSFNMPVLPTAPALQFPDLPALQTLSIPAMPGVSIPQFTSTLPVADITLPTQVFQFVEQQYNSALLDSLKAKLMQDMAGGYGIETADELALWDRARGRELQSAAAAVSDVSRQAAARNFMLPPGALFAQIEAARSASLEKISDLSRDIMIKRGDMYVENRKFTIEQARELEQILMGYFGSMMERALNVARAMVELDIALYNARVAKANYYLERLKVEAQVFETQLRAALANLEAWKAQLEGLRVEAEVQRNLVTLYTAQLEGVKVLEDLYRAQLEGAKILADIQMLELQAAKLGVDTYVAEVGAKTAEFGMYESEIRGETLKIGLYEAQARTFGIQVDASKNLAQTEQIKLEAQIESRRLDLDKNRLELERYRADLENAQAYLREQVAVFDAKTRLYVTEQTVNTHNNEMQVAVNRDNVTLAEQAVNLRAQVAIARGNQLISNVAAAEHVGTTLAGSYGNLGASALNIASGMVINATSA
jgi:hypothetical protein